MDETIYAKPSGAIIENHLKVRHVQPATELVPHLAEAGDASKLRLS